MHAWRLVAFAALDVAADERRRSRGPARSAARALRDRDRRRPVIERSASSARGSRGRPPGSCSTPPPARGSRRRSLPARPSGQLALDHVTAAGPSAGSVDEAHDAEHALAEDDALAGGDRVATELDALVRRARPTGAVVVAVMTGPLPGRAASVPGRLEPLDDPCVVAAATAMSSWTARISRRRSATGSGVRRLSASIARDASARVLGDDERDAALDARAGAGSAAGGPWAAAGWLAVGGDRSWPRLGAARGAVKPWSVRTREATRQGRA